MRVSTGASSDTGRDATAASDNAAEASVVPGAFVDAAIGDGASELDAAVTMPSDRATTAASIVIAISVAGPYACALLADGSVECWGRDLEGGSATVWPPPWRRRRAWRPGAERIPRLARAIGSYLL